MPNKARFAELKASGKLPSPKGVALELMRLSQNPKASLHELAQLLRLDPALTGKMVQFANSARFAAHRHTAAAVEAVQRLGMETVRQLALSFSVIGNNRTGACRTFDYEGFWTIALLRAVAAKELALMDRAVVPEEAFTCAILLKIGQLAMASVYPQEYAECLGREGADDWERLPQLEQAAFAIDHGQVTQELLREWGFPRVLTEAVGLAYQFPRTPNCGDNRAERFAAQLRLASGLAACLLVTTRRRNHSPTNLIPLAQQLGLSARNLEEIAERMESSRRELSVLFDIRLPEMSPLIMADTVGQPSPANRRTRVLLVGDEPRELLRLQSALQSESYSVVRAHSAEDGLQQVLDDDPMLIIVDERPQGLDGLKFVRHIRELEAGRCAYVLLISASCADQYMTHAYSAGVNDYVAGPVDTPILKARIEGAQRFLELRFQGERERELVRRQLCDLAISKRKLESLAMTDPLTKIPNRRYASARIREEWSAWRRTGHPLSVLVIDLDHFKRINDNFGHQAGDRVLAHVANIISMSLRASDIVCRMGGEEFIIIAPNADQTAARILAERVRQAIESRPLDPLQPAKGITASIGIATTEAGIINSTELIQLADEALYEAKLAGRNRVQHSSRGKSSQPGVSLGPRKIGAFSIQLPD